MLVDEVWVGAVLGPVAALAVFFVVIAATLRWMPIVLATLAVGVVEGHLGTELGFRVADRTVSPADLIFIAAAAAGTVRLMAGGGLTRMQLLWGATFVALLAAFANGAMTYGFDTAVTFYRRFFYLSAGTLYALTFPWTPEDLDRLARLWIAAGVFMACLTVVSWIDPDLTLWFQAGALTASAALYEAERVLPAVSAFLIAQAGLLCLAMWSRLDVSPLYRAAGVPLLLIAILLYHRSVWVVMVTALAVLPLINPRAMLRLGLAALLIPFALLLVWIIGMGLGQDILSASMSAALQEPLTDNSTLSWRVTGWRILVDRTLAGGLPSMLFGSGFGTGYERMIGWSTIQYSPHNLYVELFVNAGIVGSGLWILSLLAMVLRLWRSADGGGLLFDRTAGIVLTVAVASFGVPYTPAIEQGLLIGAIAALAQRSERRAASPAPAPREAVA